MTLTIVLRLKMGNSIGKWLILLLACLACYQANAQCTVKAYSDPTVNYCGNPFYPYAIGDAGTYDTAYSNDFNSSTLGNNCTASTPIIYDNPCQSADGTPSAWIGRGTDNDRNITIQNINVQTGGKICFDLKFAEKNGTDPTRPDCEAPDQLQEGVYLQYSIDAGITWQNIFYFDPSPLTTSPYLVWKNYCFDLPLAALTSSTHFRWHQEKTSGNSANDPGSVDHWGIDNIYVIVNDPNFEFIWDHTTVKGRFPGYHVPPTSPFTYRVTLKHKNTNQQCVSTTTVTTIAPQITVTPGPISSCAGTPVQLNSTYSFPSDIAACGIETRGCMGTPGTKTIGGGAVKSDIVFNSATYGSIKSQFIIRSSELTFTDGQINSITLDAFDNGFANKVFLNFKVKIACTTKSSFSNGDFETGLTTVYDELSFNFKNGLNTIDFDQYFNWNGTSNIVIEICWSNTFISSSLPLNGENLAWNAGNYLTAGTNNPTNCGRTTGGIQTTFRPKFGIGYCTPVISSNLGYTWTPSTGLSSSTSRNPQASPTSSTNYSVEIVDLDHPQCRVSGSVQVNVVNVTQGQDTSLVICRSSTSLNLFPLLKGNPPGGGTWKDPSGTTFSGTINPTSAAAGAYSYLVNDANCGTSTSKINLTFETQLNPGTDNDSTFCNTKSAINLFSVLDGSPNTGGTWADNNFTGALNNGIFDATKVSPGTYRFTYTIPATTNCPARSAVVNITVVARPNAGQNTSASVCNSAGTVNILNLLGGSPQSGGTWTNNNGAGTLSGNNLNISGVPNGTYTYTYTLPATIYCPGTNSILTLTIIAQPFAGGNGSISVCQSAGPLNLFTVLTGSPDQGGTWIDNANTGKMSPSGILTITGLSAATYTFKYTINVTGCPKSDATVTVNVIKQNSAGTGRDTLICSTTLFNLFNLLNGHSTGGTWADVSNTGRLSGSNFNTVGISAGSYTFRYSVNSVSPCTNQSVDVIVSTERPADAGTGKTLKLCKGETRSLSAEITGTPTGGGSWSSIPALIGLNASTGNLNTTNSAAGNYQVRFVVTGKAPCSNDTAFFPVSINEKPVASNIQYFCINQNRQYYVEFEVNKGQSSSYTFTPTGTKLPGSPYRFRSAPIVSKTGVTFYVDDANNCGPDSIIAFYNCGCVTQPGTTGLDTLTICENMVAKAPYDNGFVNDGNDTLVFALHEGNGDSLVNPKAYNFKPEFSFVSGMVYGKVYYISAMAADKGTTNGYNPADTCYEVSPGTPVIFHPIPTYSYSENSPLCQGENLAINFVFSKGTPPFRVFYAYQGSSNSQSFPGVTGQLNFVASSTEDFIITSIASQGCVISFTQRIPIAVDDSLSISNFQFLCNNDNNGYNISFDITKGNPALYKVTGINGTLVGNRFTSVELASPSSYNFTVSDGSVCPPKAFNGTYICPCVTQAGTMSNTNLLKICGNDTARAPFNNNQQLDGNDSHYFILHTTSGTAGVVKKISKSPAFAYDNSLVYGTRYYISAIAGDSTVGFINTSERCFSISPSVPVEFYPQPSGAINGDTSLCEGQSLDLKPVLSGFGPFKLNFTDQSGRLYAFPSVMSGDPVLVSPPPGTYFIRFKDLQDLSSGCIGDTSGVYKIQVVTSPKGTMDGDTSYCNGLGQARIRLHLSGVKPFNGTVSLNGTPEEIFSNADTEYEFLSSPPPGRNVYKITDLHDASLAACPGISTDSVVVTVFPIPAVTISGNSSVCSGDGAYVHFNVSNIYNGYPGQYLITLNQQPANTNVTYLLKGITDSLLVQPQTGFNSYTITNVTDQFSGCTGTSSGTAVITAIQRPKALLTGDTTFCDSINNIANLKMTLSGAGQVTVYYSDNQDNQFSYTGVEKPTAYIIPHSVLPRLTIFMIDSVVDGSGLNCTGLYSGKASIQVHTLPTVILSVNGSKSGEVCEGDSAYIRIEATGTLPLSVDIRDELGTNYSSTLTSSLIDSILVFPSAGQHSYYLQKLSDGNTPVCSGNSIDSVSIKVNPRPVITMNLVDDTICAGQTATLIFTVVQGVLPIEVFYAVDGVTAAAPVVLSGGIASEVLNLLAGLHTISITSIKDLAASGCIGNSASVPSVQLLVRSLPTVVSLIASPNPVCFNTKTTVSYSTNSTGPLEITFSSVDSSWTENFVNAGSFVLGPMQFPRSIKVSSLKYVDNPQCPVNPGTEIAIAINPLPTARIITPDTSVCEADQFPISVVLTGTGVVSGSITNANGDLFSFSSSTGFAQTMAKTVTSGYFYFPPNTIVDGVGCRNTGTDSVYVTIHPLPIIDFEAKPAQSCVPLSTYLVNLTDGKYIGGNCTWNIGQGLYTFNTCDSTPEIKLERSGSYDAALTVTTPFGCMDTYTRKDYLKAHPKPIADFSYSPDKVYISNTIVQFTDRSTNATSWAWDFEEFGLKNTRNPVVEFPAEPDLEVHVHLTVRSNFECVDSISKKFKIIGELLVNVPNAFTPNGDGNNDIFIPVIFGLREAGSYEFQVFDRWGELIFETTDHTKGWNGTYKNGAVEMGVYAYRLKVQSKYSVEAREYIGHVNLVR